MESEMADGSGEKDPLYGFSEGELLSILRRMLLYRRFEEKAEEATPLGRSAGSATSISGRRGPPRGASAR